jgi:hypothetical protein
LFFFFLAHVQGYSSFWLFSCDICVVHTWRTWRLTARLQEEPPQIKGKRSKRQSRKHGPTHTHNRLAQTHRVTERQNHTIFPSNMIPWDHSGAPLDRWALLKDHRHAVAKPS